MRFQTKFGRQRSSHRSQIGDHRQEKYALFCLWIPNYPAWALAQTQPHLRAQPFAVCERGMVIAASPSALAHGVQIGMSSSRAKSRQSSLLITGRDRHVEELSWSEIQRAFYGLTPKVEAVAPGLLFAEVVQDRTLPLLRAWRAQGGEASDRATAHLATLTADPGHSRHIKPNRERDFIGITPIAYLRETGISERTIERLSWFGWNNIGQLASLSRRQLEEQVGAEGLLLHRFAQGQKFKANLTPIAQWTPPPEIAESFLFEAAATQPAHWDNALNDLLVRCCHQLGTQQAQTIEVTAHTPVAPVTSRRILKEPISNPKSLRNPAESALSEALTILHPLPPVISKLEVRLGALTCIPFQQRLFEDERETRSKRLQSALRHLEERMPGHIGHYAAAALHSPFVEDHYRWQTVAV